MLIKRAKGQLVGFLCDLPLHLIHPAFFAIMSNTAVGNVYQAIIDEVINSSRVDFEENGVEEAVLEELRQVSPAEILLLCIAFDTTCAECLRGAFVVPLDQAQNASERWQPSRLLSQVRSTRTYAFTVAPRDECDAFLVISVMVSSSD